MLYVNYSGSVGKESACDAGDAGRWEFEPQVRKILCRRARKPTPVFSPGEPHRQRSLENYITVHGLQRVGCNGTCTFSPRLPPCSIHSTLMSSKPPAVPWCGPRKQPWRSTDVIGQQCILTAHLSTDKTSMMRNNISVPYAFWRIMMF